MPVELPVHGYQHHAQVAPNGRHVAPDGLQDRLVQRVLLGHRAGGVGGHRHGRQLRRRLRCAGILRHLLEELWPGGGWGAQGGGGSSAKGMRAACGQGSAEAHGLTPAWGTGWPAVLSFRSGHMVLDYIDRPGAACRCGGDGRSTLRREGDWRAACVAVVCVVDAALGVVCLGAGHSKSGWVIRGKASVHCKPGGRQGGSRGPIANCPSAEGLQLQAPAYRGSQSLRQTALRPLQHCMPMSASTRHHRCSHKHAHSPHSPCTSLPFTRPNPCDLLPSKTSCPLLCRKTGLWPACHLPHSPAACKPSVLFDWAASLAASSADSGR